MSGAAQATGRPGRWDKPFGDRPMPESDIDRVVALPAFAAVDPAEFPATLPLREVIANDARVRRYSRGDIIVRRGDYGNSVFIIIEGSVRGFASEAAEKAIASTTPLERKGWYSALAQLWRNSSIPEYRAAVRYSSGHDAGKVREKEVFRLKLGRGIVVAPSYIGRDRRKLGAGLDITDAVPSGAYSGPDRRRTTDRYDEHIVTQLENVDEIISEFRTFTIEAPEMFGELAALSRSPRGATIFADSDNVECVELRWQGLRDIRQWSDWFSKKIDDLYRQRGLIAHLQASPIFRHLDDPTLEIIANQTLFETHGTFEWSQAFQRARDEGAGVEAMIQQEPVIAEQGHYLDGLLLIRSGFARVSVALDHGERTVGYVSTNDVFGLEELVGSVRGTGTHRLQHSLRAIGYVDLLRVPTNLVEQYVLPFLPPDLLPGKNRKATAGSRQSGSGSGQSGWDIEQPLIDFLIDNRIINATAAMLVNTDRCVNCDDCVRACAATHGGNPRFVRHGIAQNNLMVVNACMHCVDPVCLIGCPTGAIHRSAETGNVIIDDATCIGCATCALSCPYNDIRMVETRNETGAFIVDADFQPITKATKCDLCVGQLGSPACERACPHDALVRIDIRDYGKLKRWLEA